MVRRKYTKEFKIEAVRLVEDSDVPVDEVAHELGIHPNQRWVTCRRWPLNLYPFHPNLVSSFSGSFHVQQIRPLKKSKLLIVN